MMTAASLMISCSPKIDGATGLELLRKPIVALARAANEDGGPQTAKATRNVVATWQAAIGEGPR